jgi:hypothetical protein
MCGSLSGSRYRDPQGINCAPFRKVEIPARGFLVIQITEQRTHDAINRCGTTYNGKTGKSNITAIIIYTVVILVVCLII